MQELWLEFSTNWPQTAEMTATALRLLLAVVVGALPGFERERRGMPAGFRTHILVSLGAAMFVMSALEAGASNESMTRVVQGVVTGIGFVGAGAIFRAGTAGEVRGLTTAASIWLTAALGTAVGMGQIWLPLAGSVLALIVLDYLKRFDWPGPASNTPLPPTQ